MKPLLTTLVVAGLLGLLAHVSNASSVYWSNGMYLADKAGDADGSFVARGVVGAQCSPSGSGVFITVRGRLTCSMWSAWYKDVTLTAVPVWYPVPGAGIGSANVDLDFAMNPPQNFTMTHTATVIDSYSAVYAGTTSHTTTVVVTN